MAGAVRLCAGCARLVFAERRRNGADGPSRADLLAWFRGAIFPNPSMTADKNTEKADPAEVHG